MNTKNILSTFLLVAISLNIHAQSLSTEENNLYNSIMEYRKQKGLNEIPLSKSLTFVAQTHVKDLVDNKPNLGGCNLHSWSANGKWTPVCYKDGNGSSKYMWSKPGELTNYPANGYEIAFWSSGEATASEALDS